LKFIYAKRPLLESARFFKYLELKDSGDRAMFSGKDNHLAIN